MTGCECSEAGWCARHQVYKSAHWVKLCQTDERYWRDWEAGCGIGQKKAPPGLGDLVESGLAAVGITKARYVAVKAALGLKRRCGCLERKQKLNKLGKKLGIGTK